MTKSTLPTEQQLRERIAHYPEEALDQAIWLRGYVHRRCENNVNELVEHARRRGFNQDYNYFYQVLTGRYFRKNGAGKIQGSVKNLAELCNQLRVFDKFAASLAKLRFVETTVWERINDYVQMKRTPFNACRFGAIIGYTGNQKSECFKEIVRREQPGVVLHIEAPAEPSLSQFVHKLGYLFGAALHDGIATKRNRIREKITEGTCLIIDNVQRCYDPRRKESQPIFSYLQELQDDTRCTVILSWTPVALKFDEDLGNAYFEQFLGRIGGRREILKIEDYPCDEDIEMIAESFQLSAEEIKLAMPRMRKLAREEGRVRALFNALQGGSRIATMAKEPFAAKHLLQVAGE